MISFQSIRLLGTMEHKPNYKHDQESVFVIEGVNYNPKPNLEIERVGIFSLDELPHDISKELKKRILLYGADVFSTIQHRGSNLPEAKGNCCCNP